MSSRYGQKCCLFERLDLINSRSESHKILNLTRISHSLRLLGYYVYLWHAEHAPKTVCQIMLTLIPRLTAVLGSVCVCGCVCVCISACLRALAECVQRLFRAVKAASWHAKSLYKSRYVAAGHLMRRRSCRTSHCSAPSSAHCSAHSYSPSSFTQFSLFACRFACFVQCFAYCFSFCFSLAATHSTSCLALASLAPPLAASLAVPLSLLLTQNCATRHIFHTFVL